MIRTHCQISYKTHQPTNPPTENKQLDEVIKSLDQATDALREAASNYPKTKYVNNHYARNNVIFKKIIEGPN